MDGLKVVSSVPNTPREKRRMLKDGKHAGRASASFSEREIGWLNDAMMSLLTKNSRRLAELAGDRAGISVAQKALTLKKAVAKNAARNQAKAEMAKRKAAAVTLAEVTAETSS